MKTLELKNITKTFGDLTVLNNLSFKIEAGKSVAVIGPSGTGKTTLLNIASLLDTPTSGEIFYFGKKVDLSEYLQIRRNFVSYVYQQHNLMPEFSVLENIEIIANMKNSYDLPSIMKIIKEIGIEDIIHKKPSQLSGGQKQRASIVRAIAARPKILFADEPTGNLDPLSANISANLLTSLAKNSGIAVFLITHNPEIAKKCDYIYRLELGNLVRE
jgi:ABC-type lipoprotein export system ATPase subunit